jgi:division protein CdvB (Snf7/Vps24/ESCRT-III family)
MMQAMKGATMALGSMNKSMNLPQLQRIAMEFERENDIMEQRQEMMDDAIDDAMDVGVEEEGDEVVEQVLEEIGIDFNQAVSNRSNSPHALEANNDHLARRNPDWTGKYCRDRRQDCTSRWWWRRW